MQILRESPWYNQMIEEGLQQGLQQGALTVIKKRLVRQFGTIPQNLQRSLDRLSIAQLEELEEQSLNFIVIADLESWLEQQATEKISD